MSGTTTLANADFRAKMANRKLESEGDLERQRGLERHRAGSVLDPTLATLARELAQDILPPDDILRSYGFSGVNDPAWITVKDTPEFDRLLQSAIAEWTSATNTRKRIQVKAQTTVELAIPTVYGITQDGAAKEADRLKAFELLARVGGVGTEAAANAGGGRPSFVLNINLANGKTLTVQDQPRPPVLEGEATEDSGSGAESSLTVSMGSGAGASQFVLGEVIEPDSEF